ncbi:MAG: hypothetical protein K2P84_00850 [Undibacterium sp.]|nr:hypothetical protein [Undibacterium sp.]
MYRFLFCSICTVLLASTSFAAQPISHRYQVKIDQAATRAHVDAELTMDGTQLALYNVIPMPNLPEGQASYLENLKITDTQGQAIPYKNNGEGEFEITGAANTASRKIHLSYDVRLEHDRLEWPPGNEEVLYHTDEGVMMTGYTLFLVPSQTMNGETQVEFLLPAGWHANTAMRADTSHQQGHSMFIAKTRRELVNNAYFFGTAHADQMDAGGLQLTLVLGQRYWPQRQMFKDLLGKQLHTYLQLFGHKPSGERYLIIINQGDSGDGGAFSSSFSQFLRGDAELATRQIWGRVLAHELLHFWNGLSLIPQDDREEWFKEGITDYLTISTMAQNKFVDQRYVQQWLENLSRGQTVARRAQGIKGSIRDAAKDKHQNWLLVYGGGSIAGIALDIELRKNSNNHLSLASLMQAMYEEFALTGKHYQLSDVVRVANRLSHKDMTPMFNQLVENQGIFDLGPMFNDIGLQLDQYLMLEHSLRKNPKASSLERARYSQIFGSNF